MGLMFKIVEESITAFQSQELVGYDALERGTHEGVVDGTLRDTSDKQIDVIHWAIQQFETFYDLSGEMHKSHRWISFVILNYVYFWLRNIYRSGNDIEQVVKVSGGRQAAQGTIRIVTRDSVISSALDVQRDQIHSVRFSLFLEQMVRQLFQIKKKKE